jgi:hypothetical protein
MRRSGDRRKRRSAATRRRAATAACLTALALTCLACGGAARDASWPEGALLVGRTAALRSVIEDLQQLRGTPLAEAADALAARLPDCTQLEGHAPDGTLHGLLASLRCAQPNSALAELESARGESDLLIALPTSSGGHVSIRAQVDARAIALAVHWPDAPTQGALSLLLPGAMPAGADLLNDHERLLHVRVRPAGGLDLAALVPARSQADRLFRLRSALFAGAVLDGSWEAALYSPEPQHTMPRAALALAHRVRGAAQAAIEQFIAELASTWPVRRSDFALGEASGACLSDLNILPDLAPCYVATEHALVIGWNAASVAAGLAAPRDTEHEPVAAEAGRAQIDFERVRAVDTQLSKRLGAAADARRGGLPWRQLDAHGTRKGDVLELRLELIREAAS